MSESAYTRVVGAAVLAMLCSILTGCGGAARQADNPAKYVPDANYHLLMAEIADQRGEHQVAVQEYLAAAVEGRDSEVARRATEYAFEFGYDGFALKAAGRWLKLAPDSSSARDYLGRLQLRRHDLQAAYRYYSELLGPVETRNGDDYLDLESELSGELNAAGVTRLLVWLGAGVAPSPDYQLAVAHAAYRSRDDALALASARNAARYGDSLEAELLIGRVLFASGDSDSALRYFAGLLQEQPMPLLELEFVRMLAASRRERAALQAVDRMIETYGRQAELLVLRARILVTDGELEEAADAYRELADTGQNVYESFYYLGQIAADNGDTQEAVRQYLRVGAGGYLLPAQLRIAELRADAGDVDGAVLHLDSFSALHPRLAFEVLVGKAQLLERSDRDEAALAAYTQALRFKPDLPSLLLSRGIVNDRLDNADRAIQDLRRARDLAPYDPGALNALGYTLLSHERRQREAVRMIRLALEQDPDNPAILDSMGWAQFLTGNYGDARIYLQLAYDVFPDPEVAAHLGEVMWKLDDRDQARRIWQEALIVHPDSKPLLETTARFLD